MKQEQRRQQTTQLLLKTVKELIRDKGCDAVTMKDIMDRSGLSKGAIFHYVKSKDELFAWVLRERLSDIDSRFRQEAYEKSKDFEGPFREITRGLDDIQNPEDTTNRILTYLLGKRGQPEVDEVLGQFYELSVTLSRNWIQSGQEAGVIPDSVDTDKVGELFVLITFGLRMRASMPGYKSAYTAEDFTALMRNILQKQER